MIDYSHADLFLKDGIGKQMTIVTDDKSVTITNNELHFENFELQESLCSQGSLVFGSCESSQIKFKISNVFLPLVGKWITVSETLQGAESEPFVFGRYKVVSDVPTADKRYRNVTAYDAMYDLLKMDVSEWYNTLLPNSDSTVALKHFRDSFFSYVGITQDSVTLVNDSMTVEKTILPSELSGKDVITAICEINGVFGHIGRNGNFQFIKLEKIITALYPKNDLYPSNDLFPREPSTTRISRSNYKSVEYEDFICKSINKLQIRQEENDIGTVYPDGELKDTDNCYIVEDNFLVYGKNPTDLAEIARKLYGVISVVSYRQFKAAALSNPCLEVGDQVRLHTNLEIIETYILQRTIKGIQLLTDTLSAKGVETYDKKVNGVMRSIQQLKGKTNVLERNVEETRSTITDVEKGLKSEIKQNADNISAEVKRATDKEGELSSSIKINADSITSEVKRATDKEGELSSSIKQTNDNITAEVKRAQAQEVELAAAISINADNITSKVSRGDVSSEISQEADQITIKGNRFVLESDNCSITADGTLTVNKATINGSIRSTADNGFYAELSAGYLSFVSEYGLKTTLRAYKTALTIDGNVTVNGSLRAVGYTGNINVVRSITTTNKTVRSATVLNNLTTINVSKTTVNGVSVVTDVTFSKNTTEIGGYEAITGVNVTNGFINVEAAVVTSVT